MKSPPIYVSEVQNIDRLKEVLMKIDSNYILKVLAGNEVRIQPSSLKKNLFIMEELKKLNTKFYTFQRKQDRCYKSY